MRTAIAAALIAIVAAAAPPAAAELVLFQGVLGVRAATSDCGILPYVEQGNLYRAAYRPANVGTNGPSSSLIVAPMAEKMTDILISSFKLNNASLNGTYQQVDAIQVFSTQRMSLNFEKYKGLTRVAAPGDTDGADFVTLTMQIRGFGNVPGCTRPCAAS